MMFCRLVEGGKRFISHRLWSRGGIWAWVNDFIERLMRGGGTVHKTSLRSRANMRS